MTTVKIVQYSDDLGLLALGACTVGRVMVVMSECICLFLITKSAAYLILHREQGVIEAFSRFLSHGFH